MYNNPLRSDVTFVVEGVSLYAHSCILMSRCEPLEKMLDGRTMDSSLPEIQVPDCSVGLRCHRQVFWARLTITALCRRVQHAAFSALLEFLYTDEVPALDHPNVDVDFLLELASLADQYLVNVLKKSVKILRTKGKEP
jgi:hypothetical protein